MHLLYRKYWQEFDLIEKHVLALAALVKSVESLIMFEMFVMILGEQQFSYGYGGTAKASTENKFEDYGQTFGVGDVITAYLVISIRIRLHNFNYCIYIGDY